MRKTDWPERLQIVIKKYSSTPFAYGKCDCWLFVTEAISAVVDNPLYQQAIESGYKTVEEGLRNMHNAYGVKRYTELPSKFFKCIKPRLARRGDLVMFNKAMGICMGQYSCFLSENGLFYIKTTQCMCAWRIE